MEQGPTESSAHKRLGMRGASTRKPTHAGDSPAAGLSRQGSVDQTAFMCETARRVRAASVTRWGEDAGVDIVGRSPGFVDVVNKLAKIARYTEPVLISGESGVGKEQLAQGIYLLSDLGDKPYVPVNCPQYREDNLSASELFGHTKGSFTGAIADRKGAFEAADGGVIFLDEIGDLDISVQAMLLRALASNEYKPLGSDRARSADVRVVAATNRLDRIRVGQEFRDDLYFRLRYFFLPVPPLRERGEDWRLILEYYLVKLRRKYGVAKHFSKSSLRLLESYDWPGNVRQLISVATMGYAMTDGDTIEAGDFASLIDVPNGTQHSAEDLFERVVHNKEDFWRIVHQPFMKRDLNRNQVKAVIKQGLLNARGSYRRLLDVLHIPASEYQRFMDFLRHQKLKP
jgi:transcriptional regulator with GAF, ATPase, and Fis domain